MAIKSDADACQLLGHTWAWLPECNRCGAANPFHKPGVEKCAGSGLSPTKLTPVPMGATRSQKNNRTGQCGTCGQTVAAILNGMAVVAREHSKVAA